MVGRVTLAVALASATGAWAQSAPSEDATGRIMAARPAGVPLAADPLDTGQRSAPVWFKGDRPTDNIFAKLTLRPVAGAVLTGAAPGNAPKVLLLTHVGDQAAVSARGAALAGKARTYCGAAGPELVACFEDADGDGRFEALRRGVGANAAGPESVEIVGAPEPLPAPVAYRAATPAELPSFEARVEQCGRDYDLPRFSFYVPSSAPPSIDMGSLPAALRDNPEAIANILRGAIDRGACETPERAAVGGGLAVRMRDVLLAIGPKDQGAPTRLLGTVEGDHVYRLDGRTVRSFASAATAQQDALAAKQKFPKPTYAATGDWRVEAGARGAGDVVLTAGFRHGYTGRLTTDTKIRTLFSSRSLPAGTVLYGLPMQSSSHMTVNGVPQGLPAFATRPTAANTDLTWCVPVQDEGKWSATCLPTQGGRRYTILKGQRPAFEVSSLTYDAGTSTNDGATPVAEAPGDFGRPLAYRFRIKAVAPASITLTQETLFGDEVVNSRDLPVARLPGRASALLVGSGAVTLAEAPDGKVLVAERAASRAGEPFAVEGGVLRAGAATAEAK